MTRCPPASVPTLRRRGEASVSAAGYNGDCGAAQREAVAAGMPSISAADGIVTAFRRAIFFATSR
jgi:hypothetical protein